jgi:hypothetical protein
MDDSQEDDVFFSASNSAEKRATVSFSTVRAEQFMAISGRRRRPFPWFVYDAGHFRPEHRLFDGREGQCNKTPKRQVKTKLWSDRQAATRSKRDLSHGLHP